MKFSYHNRLVELDDDWWAEAEMIGFVPKSRAYRASNSYKNEHVLEISIENVGPLLRPEIFKDDPYEERQTARERVLRLLKGFRAGDLIPPVEVERAPPAYGYPYKLTHGAHRLYFSLAAGFTHVPAIKGVDWQNL